MVVVVVVVVVVGGAVSSAPPPPPRRRRPCRQPQQRQEAVDDAVAVTYPTPAIVVRARVRRTPFAFRATMSIRARVRAMPGAVFPRPYTASTTIRLHGVATTMMTIATAAALYPRTWPKSR